METGYKSEFNSGWKPFFSVDKTAEKMVGTWVKLGTCTRIAVSAYIGGVYEKAVYPLLLPLSVRRLYTFFTQAKDTDLSI